MHSLHNLLMMLILKLLKFLPNVLIKRCLIILNFLKNYLSKECVLQKEEIVELTEMISAVLLKKLPPKLGDPGLPIIPCSI